ncbi:hypothetical protein [Planktothrix phage Pra-JY27]|nr:hypothetical protein [Planktothrix phage Pag-Yong1]WEV89249.1 hypothetical protein [Synechococcus phage MinM2]
MNPVLAGQLRHIATGVGGAIAGGAATASVAAPGVIPITTEALVGGLVMWAVGQVASWASKRPKD